MGKYIIRALFEHQLPPKVSSYSSFLEYLILGKWELREGRYCSDLLEGENEDLSLLSEKIRLTFEDQYINADNQLLSICFREIVSIEDLPDEVSFDQEMLCIDERLYTFDRKLSFEEFKEQYHFGEYGG